MRRIRTLLSPSSLSRWQAIVGLITGVMSIAGAAYSFVPGLKPTKGELVAFVRDAGSDKAVVDAALEILTADDALVTSITPDSSGRAQHTVRQGPYRFRVSHPRYATEIRHVQVVAGETTEVRVRLVKRPTTSAHGGATSSPLAAPERAVRAGLNSLRRVFE